MLKPGSTYLSPKSPSNNDGKGKKAAGSRPKSTRVQNETSKGNATSKGKVAKSNSSNLFSMIMDDGSHEASQSSQHDNKDEVSMQGVSTQNDTGETKKRNKNVRNKFSHKMYENATLIYAYFKGEITSSQLPTFSDEYQKRRAYSIAFAAKRYEEVLKDVLLDCHFFSMYTQLEEEQGKVMVLLMDYFDHNFKFSDSKRTMINEDTEDPHEDIRDIQEAIVAQHVHICASFARCRIRDCALTLEDLIQDGNKETRLYAQQQPLYARVNTLKTTTDDVVNMLERQGFVLAENAELSELTDKMFRKDPHFDDMLVFSKECKDDVYSHNITLDLWLCPQDKSKYVIVEVMKSLLGEMETTQDQATKFGVGELKSFLVSNEDVLLTNLDSGSLIAHLASFISPERKLYICGCPLDSHAGVQRQFAANGFKNYELIEEAFTSLSHSDERLKRVRVILCNVFCSKSAVVNPVDFILQEGNVAAKLLSSTIDVGKQRAIVTDEYMTLKHSFTFSHVQSILYFTLSDKSTENEGLVMRALNEHRQDESAMKNPFQLTPFLPDLVSKLRAHLQNADGGEETLSMGSDEQYLKLKPSAQMNGCFVALLKRQYVEAIPKDVIDRHMKKGPKSRASKKPHAQKYTKESTFKKEDGPSEGKGQKDFVFHKFF